MENPEEILHSLEEFSKLRPKDIPRELEEYLCFVAKTGDPVYQWSAVKSLFREKLINVITEFYESCPSVEIPPCRNVELFNYEGMKNFILEKLDTFVAAPFTVQRICELLTTPRKEYNRIDKYMRALEKNILVVSTTEPGNRRQHHENADGIVNGLESEHASGPNISSNDINVEEMDDGPVWSRVTHQSNSFDSTENGIVVETQMPQNVADSTAEATFSSESQTSEATCSSTPDSLSVTCVAAEQQPYVSIEPVAADSCLRQGEINKSDKVSVTITALPTGIQKRRNSVEPVAPENITEEAVLSSENVSSEELSPNTEQSEVSQTPENADSTSTSTPTEEVTKEDEPQEEPQNDISTTKDAEDAQETKEDAVSSVDNVISQPSESTNETEQISNSDDVTEAASETAEDDKDDDAETASKDEISSSTEEIKAEASPGDEEASIDATEKDEEAANEGSSECAVDSTKPFEEEAAEHNPEELPSDKSEVPEEGDVQTPMEVDDKQDHEPEVTVESSGDSNL